MGITRFEQRLEGAVEGFFSRVFRSGLRPVEFGRKLVRDLDANRTVGVRGRTLVPNHFVFTMHPTDHEQLAEMSTGLRRDLADAAREHARDEGYAFAGPVEVELETDPEQRPGTFSLTSRFREGDGGAPPGSLVLPNGDRVPLGEYIVTIGRGPDSTIVLGDPNASRNHAEVRLESGGYIVADLGSTNGTQVNGVRVGEHLLDDGDTVTFGATSLRYESA